MYPIRATLLPSVRGTGKCRGSKEAMLLWLSEEAQSENTSDAYMYQRLASDPLAHKAFYRPKR